MNRESRISIRIALVAMSLVIAMRFTPNPSAQEQKSPSLPLPEMQRLAKFYVGTWTYTETYPKSAAAPNGAVNTGIYSSELGPGGNSIVNHFHSKGPAGESVGMMAMTWDPKEKAYKSYVFGGDFPGAFVMTGQFDGDSLVYHAEISAGALKVALRNVSTIAADGRMISDEYSGRKGALEALLVHVEAVKQ